MALGTLGRDGTREEQQTSRVKFLPCAGATFPYDFCARSHNYLEEMSFFGDDADT